MAPRQWRDTLNVVAVFVCDEYRREVFRYEPQSREPVARLLQCKAAVHEQAHTINRNQRAVAAAAAAERCEGRCAARRCEGNGELFGERRYVANSRIMMRICSASSAGARWPLSSNTVRSNPGDLGSIRIVTLRRFSPWNHRVHNDGFSS